MMTEDMLAFEEPQIQEIDPFADYIGRQPEGSIAATILEKAKAWNNSVMSSGIQRQWRQNYRQYYNVDPHGYTFDDQSFAVTGENGQVLKIFINKMRNYITHILNITCSEKIAWQTKASNSEPESINAAQIFRNVLDYYADHWKKGRVKKSLRKSVEYCLFMSNGYVLIEWDAQIGPKYTVTEDGAEIKQGDLAVTPYSVWDVYFDTRCEDEEELDWMIFRSHINKYELAARFPDKQNEILGLQTKSDLEQFSFWNGGQNETDLVPIYKFYHRSTNVCPGGRYVLCANEDLVLFDGDNPYTDEYDQAFIPVLTVRAAEGIGTLYGYSPANDLSPIQEAYNMVYSAIISNQAMTGVLNFWSQRGSDLSISSLAGNMNHIETAPGTPKPEVLDMGKNETNAYNLLDSLGREGDNASGINSVVRGDPEASLKAASGRALGLLQAQAVQFHSSLQASYAQLCQDFGNTVLKIFQKFATTERLVAVAGRNKVIKNAPFDQTKLRKVATVVVELANPLSKTTAGAKEEAEFLVQNGLVSTAQEYHLVSQSGSIDPLVEVDLAQLNLIEQENEVLLEGKVPPVLYVDRDEWHLPKHEALLASPYVRMNSPLLETILQHIQQHRDQMSAKAAQQQPPQQGQEQQPSQTQAPQQGEESSTLPQANIPGVGAVDLPDTATATAGMQGAM